MTVRRPPVLSIVVPAYNVEDYLATCLDSMVDVDERVEVIVVDDGSTDGTAAIAEGYEGVSLIRQANRGHGGAINTGVAAATGLYVKTVDADDWLDRVSLAALVLALGGLADAEETPDVVVTNFVYDRVDRSEPRPVRSRRRLPVGRIIDWAETTRFRPWEYLLIHSLTYRTEFLRQTGVVLPEHSFYVDNIYAFSPLFEARSLYYLDLDLYHYRIGRPGQSVSETVMVTRLDQQLAVNEAMLDKMTQSRPATRAQARYLLHYLDLVCAITSTLLLCSGRPADLKRRADFWSALKARDPRLHRLLRWSALGILANLPGPPGRRVSLMAYRLAQRIVGFN